jgi:hypothetical protein
MSAPWKVLGLDRKEWILLNLLAEAPDATVGQGTRAGASLARRGLVRVAKYGRWGITEAGRGVLAGHGELPRPYGPGAGRGRESGQGTGKGTDKGTGARAGNRARARTAPGQWVLPGLGP